MASQDASVFCAMIPKIETTGVTVRASHLHEDQTAGTTESVLPRLLYVADVQVESSYHGSALMHRLLQAYPPEKLVIVEQNLQPSLPERRLYNVRYEVLRPKAQRWINTRFHRLVALLLTLSSSWQVRRVQSLIGSFQPDAVLTVAHGFAWLTAAAFARRRRLPLHLIVHDDWPNVTPVYGLGPSWRGHHFGAIYREAVSRLCVSPSMVEAYKSRYGVEGTLLYPCRAAEVSIESSAVAGVMSRPRAGDSFERSACAFRPLTGVFAGTVNSQGYFDALAALARQLNRVGGKLLVFGPIEKSVAAARGLTMPNVEFRELLPSHRLISVCRDEADFLFVPMSFGLDERPNMELSFPSKLADYSAMGLPLLIRGPHYCSAVRWARENPGIAIVVDTKSEDDLAEAMATLSSAEARRRLAVHAKRIGDAHFSHSRAQRTLFDALIGSAPHQSPIVPRA